MTSLYVDCVRLTVLMRWRLLHLGTYKKHEVVVGYPDNVNDGCIVLYCIVFILLWCWWHMLYFLLLFVFFVRFIIIFFYTRYQHTRVSSACNLRPLFLFICRILPWLFFAAILDILMELEILLSICDAWIFQLCRCHCSSLLRAQLENCCDLNVFE